MKFTTTRHRSFDMVRRHDRPLAVCTVAASLAALGAVLPGHALADGSSTEQPAATVVAIADAASAATAAALPAVDAAQDAPTDAAATDQVAAVVEQAVAPETTSEAVPVPEPSTDSAGAAPLPPPAEPPAASTASAEVSAPEAASEPVTVPDTTPEAPDIASDTPSATATSVPDAPATPTPASPAPTSPSVSAPTTAGPANVNVSVRIGSPGDNGSVSQVNVASVPSAPPAAASRPEPGTTPTTGTRTGDDPATSSTGAGDSDSWYWSWDCLGAKFSTTISPKAPGTDALPASWTWIWNCGGNGPQYHDETPPGYHPINANVSIRIASPGDNGSVSQLNQVVATQVDQVRAQVDQVVGQTVGMTQTALGGTSLPVFVPVPQVDPSVLLPVVSLPSLTRVLVETPSLPLVGSGPAPSDITPPGVPESTFATALPPAPTVTTPADPAPAPLATTLPRSAAAPLPPAAGLRGADRRRDATSSRPTQPGHGLFLAETAASSVPRSAGASVTVSARAADHSADDGAKRSRPPVDDPPVPAPISGVSAAAVGGGGGSGGGLPFLLALPFVAALLDLARRVALDRATWPSGHRRRDPDPPG
jgi:hypothetical protein